MSTLVFIDLGGGRGIRTLTLSVNHGCKAREHTYAQPPSTLLTSIPRLIMNVY